MDVVPQLLHDPVILVSPDRVRTTLPAVAENDVPLTTTGEIVLVLYPELGEMPEIAAADAVVPVAEKLTGEPIRPALVA